MLTYKKIIFNILFNSSIFIVLLIGIQNSSQKKRINFLINQTISLPVSFIIGTSFISGSICGSILTLTIKRKNINHSAIN